MIWKIIRRFLPHRRHRNGQSQLQSATFAVCMRGQPTGDKCSNQINAIVSERNRGERVANTISRPYTTFIICAHVMERCIKWIFLFVARSYTVCDSVFSSSCISCIGPPTEFNCCFASWKIIIIITSRKIRDDVSSELKLSIRYPSLRKHGSPHATYGRRFCPIQRANVLFTWFHLFDVNTHTHTLAGTLDRTTKSNEIFSRSSISLLVGFVYLFIYFSFASTKC